MSPVGLILLVFVTSGAAFKTNANVMKRFNEMLEACTLSPTAINCIDSASQRTLFRGVAAAQANPKVRSAFAVVYHDLGPVRVAGDLIFGQLKRTATEAADSCRVLPSEDEGGPIAAGSSLTPLTPTTRAFWTRRSSSRRSRCLHPSYPPNFTSTAPLTVCSKTRPQRSSSTPLWRRRTTVTVRSPLWSGPSGFSFRVRKTQHR